MDKVLLYFALKYKGDWDKIYQALDKKEKIDLEDLENIENQIDSKYITILNPLYPNNLKNSHKPPFVIFYKGDIKLLTNYYKIVSFIEEGTISSYSKKELEALIKSFKKEDKTLLITKDQYDKYDISKEHNLIILEKSIGDVENNIEDRLYISEAYHENDNKTDMLRLLFAPSNAVIVIQIPYIGNMIKLVNFAVNDNKEIYVLPQENSSKRLGNNWLIKQGAKLVEFPSDVLNDM